MNQVNSRSEKSSTFFGGSNFIGLNNYIKLSADELTDGQDIFLRGMELEIIY